MKFQNINYRYPTKTNTKNIDDDAAVVSLYLSGSVCFCFKPGEKRAIGALNEPDYDGFVRRFLKLVDMWCEDNLSDGVDIWLQLETYNEEPEKCQKVYEALLNAVK